MPGAANVSADEGIAHSVRLQGFGLVATGSERHIAGTATNHLGYDRYIYSGS
jgi:hypothetical protein